MTLINTSTQRCLFLRVLEGTRVSVPSAVSSMLERLCPRLMPLTAGGRSTLEPLSWGVVEVTSGGTLFSGEETERERCRHADTRAATAAVQLVIRPRYRCACGPERRPAGRRRAEAAAGSWALHGRGWRRRTRTWTSFGRSG